MPRTKRCTAARREAVPVHELLPDRHRGPAVAEPALDELAERFARAAARRRRRRVGDHRRGSGRFCPVGIGDHLVKSGRFCRRTAAPTHGDPGGLEVRARGLPPHARLALDAPQRPAELAKRFYLLSFLIAQDVGHLPPADHESAGFVNVPRQAEVAGFQVILSGRFWVITEVAAVVVGSRNERRARRRDAPAAPRASHD